MTGSPPGDSERRVVLVRRVAITTILLTLAVVMVGGYGAKWDWTGLSGTVTLWDWLQVMALPLAFSASPLLLRNRRALRRKHRRILMVLANLFAVLVLAGYLVPLAWTGFEGNTFWDWLQLMLLPLVVATVALWPRPDEFRREHWIAVAAGAVVFVALVALGYLMPWRWTGFTGNTLWQWIKLLLLPVLLPTVVVPRLLERLSREENDAGP